MNREPTNINADDKHHDAIKAYQDKYLKGNDTHKDSLSFPIGSAVTMQHKGGGPCMHGVLEEANNTDHNGRSFIIRVMKGGRLIMCNM